MRHDTTEQRTTQIYKMEDHPDVIQPEDDVQEMGDIRMYVGRT